MTVPRLGQGMPPDDSWFSRQIGDLQRQIRENQAAQSVGLFSPATFNDTTTNIAIELGTVQSAALENVPVPAGFTGAVLQLTVDLDGTRDGSTSGVNQLSIQVFADVQTASVRSRTFPTASSQGFVTQTFSATLTGLSLSFPIGANVWGSSGWVANSGVGHLSALIVFLR